MRNFIIVKDLIDSGAETPMPDCFEPKPNLLPFRLHDDDGILYFEGYVLDDEEALYDAYSWGYAYAGTTSLSLKTGEGWEMTIG